MSSNIYNIISPIMIDPNRFNIKDLNIEFKKSFLINYNDNKTNHHDIPNTNDIFLNVETSRYDKTGYIKLKNTNLWLHCDDKYNMFFDVIKKQDYYYRQPMVIWFDYNRDNEMLMYKYFGKGLGAINDTIFGGYSNMMYINYKQENGKIYMNWTNDINNATKILLNKIQTYEYVWQTKPYDISNYKLL